MKLKFVCVSDSHTQHVSKLPKGDIFVHAGDWSNHGSMADLSEFAEFLDSIKSKYKYRIVIAGNHDFCAEESPAFTKELIESTGAIYLSDSGCTVEGVKVWGSPVQPWFNEWAFNRLRGSDIQRHWDMIPEDTQVLITHGPPVGIGDKLSERGSQPGKHIGCENLKATIDSKLKNLKLHVFGHIHEGHGVYESSGVRYVNASILDERYSMVNKPIKIEVDFET